MRDAGLGRGAAFVRMSRQESRSIASTTLVLLARFCRLREGTKCAQGMSKALGK